MSESIQMSEDMRRTIIEMIDSQAYRCDLLLENEDVDDMKNACAILREWTTDSGNVLLTMYFNEELDEIKDKHLMAYVEEGQLHHALYRFKLKMW